MRDDSWLPEAAQESDMEQIKDILAAARASAKRRIARPDDEQPRRAERSGRFSRPGVSVSPTEMVPRRAGGAVIR
jgi:hypothetical protein